MHPSSKNNTLPNGVITASLTPMDHSLNADHGQFVQHIQWLLSRGNDGIALLGTTGEAASFSVSERMRILEAVLDSGIPSDKLIVGTGCCSITDTIDLTKHAYEHGVKSILLLPPFYYKKVTDEGMENYMVTFLEKVGGDDIQIYLYHFPQLSGVPFTVNLTERLVARFPDNIIGMKDSGGDWSHMEEIMNALPDFRLYAGSEKFLLSNLLAGGSGCISASANLTSPEAALVYEAWKNGGGQDEQVRVSKLREAIESYPAISTLKYVFAKLSGNNDWLNVRPPNVVLTPEEGLHMEQRLREMDYWNPFSISPIER